MCRTSSRRLPAASAAHHREEIVESLIVAMDLDVMAQGRGGVVKSRFDSAELRAQVLRQTSLVERASQAGHFDQLDRAAIAGAERGVVDELGRLTAREDIFQRDVLDQEERPGAELVDQAIHGRLDVVDDVGAMVRRAELRSKQVLRQGLSVRSSSRRRSSQEASQAGISSTQSEVPARDDVTPAPELRPGDIVCPMTFDETITTLRQWIGVGVSISLTHQQHGPADGYLADFSGRLARVEEPITGVDAPVFYFRWADGSGFGVHRELFKSAGWRTIAGETALEIDLDGVTLSAVRYGYEDAEVTLTDDRAAGFGGHAGLT
jgi:hypothetical protein